MHPLFDERTAELWVLPWAPLEPPSPLTVALVVVLVVPPLPARAGGGGTSVLYRRWILSDPLGSATVVLEANPQQPGSREGRAEREVAYAPFGKAHQVAGSQGLDTDVFAGHPREATTGLHYMRARWFDPTTGTFLSVDPVVPIASKVAGTASGAPAISTTRASLTRSVKAPTCTA